MKKKVDPRSVFTNPQTV
ncbi:MAG: hypothetical protein CL912_28235 [Deltaproteobacteria bacterium]|nr:hypothetical protein [Deltaproteobacteria bacterium]